jgi:hypothetical protein
MKIFRVSGRFRGGALSAELPQANYGVLLQWHLAGLRRHRSPRRPLGPIRHGADFHHSPRGAMVAPETSPICVLERLCGQKLTAMPTADA